MKRIIWILSLCLAISACATSNNLTVQTEAAHTENFLIFQPEWETDRDFPCMSTASFRSRKFPLKYTIVKLDLNAEDTEIIIDCNKSSVKKFASENNCLLALNATPFGKQPAGIVIRNKEKLYPPEPKYSALAFFKETKGWSARIALSQENEILEKADIAAGGFFTILAEGEFVKQYIHTDDARIAAGTAENGRILYILAVDGGIFSGSRGLSFLECALIFKQLGCDYAMEFDGGNSAELCIHGKRITKIPFLRKQLVHIGFRPERM